MGFKYRFRFRVWATFRVMVRVRVTLSINLLWVASVKANDPRELRFKSRTPGCYALGCYVLGCYVGVAFLLPEKPWVRARVKVKVKVRVRVSDKLARPRQGEGYILVL